MPPRPQSIPALAALLRALWRGDGDLLGLLPDYAYRVAMGPLGYSRRSTYIVNEPGLVRQVLSEQPERFFISEIIREKIFLNYRKEVPYSTQVDIVAWEERSSEKDLIDAEIIVERDSQKGILIGKSGEALKKIGTQARADIEEFLGRGVFLRLFVKVRNDWRNNEGHLRSFGFTGV